jgi:hypothetical protein
MIKSEGGRLLDKIDRVRRKEGDYVRPVYDCEMKAFQQTLNDVQEEIMEVKPVKIPT